MTVEAILTLVPLVATVAMVVGALYVGYAVVSCVANHQRGTECT